MMEDEPRSIHEQRFDAAVKVIQSLPANGSFQPSNEMMLKFYSYYKQATQGPCNIPRPGFWDPVGKVKWDAWHSLGDMPKEEAMMAYVDDLKLILESMPMTEQVEQLLQVLGPFYELVDEKKKISQVSDLTAGIGSMMSPPSKSVTKSIIRTMEMNGTLDGHAPNKSDALMANSKVPKEQEDGGEDEDEDDDDGGDDENEEEEENKQLQKASALKKKTSMGKALPNGGIEHTVSPVVNGTHCSKSTLNGKDAEENDGEVRHVNGHTKGPSHLRTPTTQLQIKEPHPIVISLDDNEDVRSAHHVASDSDSEVYCDSVDQFGAEESSDSHVNQSLEKSCSTQEELHSTDRDSEILLRGQDGVQHGGEDGKTSGGGGGGGVQRNSLSMGRPGSSLIRRGRGSRSSGSGSGVTGTLQGAGGDGERWGSDGAGGGDLNEQIVAALTRLQEDMQSVLERLHTLEALTASQARSVALTSEYLLPPASRPHRKPSWWPFDLSPGTVAFALVWPFIAQWIIRLYFQRRRRKQR
ncbi:acyl-CoA-binding domain-containing protein 5A isoform X2 [Hemibagrus wyckioides]|uniref:acyl-CoA-binding domain-containing protein 5A isoform X2 n=1 Tax=Hemibagrus wyckioides TaxID=337641 RepID=UPI00266BA5D4|nr:acyl-CoA-binding domain-containing protein 5A isoform X2 [Hemibagrus wyckioides]